MRAALREAASMAQPGEWVLGWGLGPNSFGTIPVGSGAIEDVLNGRPVALLQGRSGRLWRVAAVKLFMDGTVDGGTGA